MMTDPAETLSPEGTAPETDEAAPRAVRDRDGPPQGEDPATAEVQAPADATTALQAEVASLKDRVLRTMAEMENLRRRTDREVADAKTYGVSSFAREMVSVADNLQRAQTSLPTDARAEVSAAVKSFIDGVELTERDLISRLARFGVKPIETTGQRFDPNRHEALFEMPDETVPNGTVVQQVETGYLIGERVLRPAKVGVSRGGPKAEAAGG
jgi:molecular chaperone GrpE